MKVLFRDTLLHDRNLIRRQPVQLIHQSIDPDIRHLDILLDEPLLLISLYLRQILVEIQHLRAIAWIRNILIASGEMDLE